MQDILPALNQYCEKFSTLRESDLLSEIERFTHLHTTAPRMLSGALQGSILSMISQIKNPKTILEIGTFTGYSAICLAQGLPANGQLITIEFDSEMATSAQTFLRKSMFNSQITLLVGDAKTIIPELTDSFDLVFIDADKESYSLYFDLVIEKCHSGALILADNVLWSGKVLNQNMDTKTSYIHQFNQKIASDPRVENVILPIRDGIHLIRKR